MSIYLIRKVKTNLKKKQNNRLCFKKSCICQSTNYSFSHRKEQQSETTKCSTIYSEIHFVWIQKKKKWATETIKYLNKWPLSSFTIFHSLIIFFLFLMLCSVLFVYFCDCFVDTFFSSLISFDMFIIVLIVIFIVIGYKNFFWTIQYPITSVWFHTFFR